MSIYTRYFQIPEPSPSAQLLLDIFEERKRIHAKYEDVGKKFGATETMFYSDDGRFAGFMFSGGDRDDAVFCKPTKDRLVVPRSTTKGGRLVKKMLKEAGTPRSLTEVYEAVGLGSGRFLMLDGMRMHGAGMSFRKEPFHFFITVPWKDVNPEELEKYREEKASGTRSEMNLSHLLWSPPSDWVEVKGWEMEKVIDEGRQEGVA